ncbi:MAG: hypothetical protein A3F18_07335 [Legionellales bacterium RIFCSPHIGHO2_12_FULL_37_14]|nr:MAG: hypothetical protein A3F18_07335 [Legionellales bacterium RIFCSPHIGHO2_12_FULL_37_14]
MPDPKEIFDDNKQFFTTQIQFLKAVKSLQEAGIGSDDPRYKANFNINKYFKLKEIYKDCGLTKHLEDYLHKLKEVLQSSPKTKVKRGNFTVEISMEELWNQGDCETVINQCEPLRRFLVDNANHPAILLNKASVDRKHLIWSIYQEYELELSVVPQANAALKTQVTESITELRNLQMRALTEDVSIIEHELHEIIVKNVDLFTRIEDFNKSRESKSFLNSLNAALSPLGGKYPKTAAKLTSVLNEVNKHLTECFLGKQDLKTTNQAIKDISEQPETKSIIYGRLVKLIDHIKQKKIVDRELDIANLKYPEAQEYKALSDELDEAYDRFTLLGEQEASDRIATLESQLETVSLRIKHKNYIKQLVEYTKANLTMYPNAHESNFVEINGSKVDLFSIATKMNDVKLTLPELLVYSDALKTKNTHIKEKIFKNKQGIISNELKVLESLTSAYNYLINLGLLPKDNDFATQIKTALTESNAKRSAPEIDQYVRKLFDLENEIMNKIAPATKSLQDEFGAIYHELNALPNANEPAMHDAIMRVYNKYALTSSINQSVNVKSQMTNYLHLLGLVCKEGVELLPAEQQQKYKQKPQLQNIYQDNTHLFFKAKEPEKPKAPNNGPQEKPKA